VHNHAVDAVPTLCCLLGNEGLLERMEFSGFPSPSRVSTCLPAAAESGVTHERIHSRNADRAIPNHYEERRATAWLGRQLQLLSYDD
jgi:hypothetical protein